MSGARVFGRDLASWRAESRAALGIPAGRFVVMTGHQAGIWHAGIAEKFTVGAGIAAERGDKRDDSPGNHEHSCDDVEEPAHNPLRSMNRPTATVARNPSMPSTSAMSRKSESPV